MLTFVGTSHHLAPIEAREQLAIPGEAVPDVLARLGERFGAGALVNTCNRMEVYLSGKHARREVLDFLAGACGADRELVRHVLGRFGADERETMAAAVLRAADATERFVAEGIERVMNAFNAAETQDPDPAG